MKSFLLFVTFVGLFALTTTLTFATTTTTSSSNNNNNNNNDPSSAFPANVFRPVSAIVTRKGGAIATIRAVIDPPIEADGYKDITLSWCSRDDWSDCLDPSSESYSSNISRDCRCTSPGSSVEDTLRFGLLDEKEQQQQQQQQQNNNDPSSQRPQKCSVVSHRWEENTQVQDLVSSPYKKIADKAQKSIRKLERELEDKVKEFNEKFLEQQVLSITSSSYNDGENDNDDDEGDEQEDEAKSLLFGNNGNRHKNKNNKNNKKSTKNKKNSLVDYLSGMKTLEKYITMQKEKIGKFRAAVAQSNAFLNNLAATGSSSSGDHTSQILERRLRHSAGRVLKVRLFCNHSSASSSSSPFSEIFAQVNLPEAQWTPTHTLLINTNENNISTSTSSSTTNTNNNNKNEKPMKNAKSSASSSEVKMAARISQQTYVDWQNVRLSLRQGAPGEDSTTTEQPPEDGQATAPWIVKIATVPPPNYEKIVEQRRSVPMNTTSARVDSTTSSASRSASATESASLSESATTTLSESATMSRSAPTPTPPQKEEQAPVEQEENIFDEQQEQEQPQNSESSITSMLGSGFTEETKLPHLVSIPKHSSAFSVVEIGSGKITASMHRVVAGFRCRQQQQQQASSNKENFGCTLPVFLRANISNADNSFYILGGPTRIIVDGVPFVSPSSSSSSSSSSPAAADLKKVVTKPIFQKSIAPGSWGWVNLGEDTKVTVQRYEKSSVMRRVLNKDTGKSKNWWENIFTSEEAEKQEAEKKKQDAEKKANNTVAIKFEFKITNSRTIPITIDLRDQYPRSNTDEIEVRLSSETLKNRFLVTSSYSDENKENNNKADSANASAQQGNEKKKVTMSDSEEIHWKVQIGASSQVVIPFGFYLTWNKDKFVHGLV